MYALEVKSISKHFKGFDLNNVSFALPTGSIMGLVGENGAGKSTTIKIILDMIKADTGEVNILGKDNKLYTRDIKEDIGVVLDEAYFPDCITVNLVNKIMAKTYENWDEKQYYNYIKKFSLPNNKQFKDFSRGMKMKLSLAVALSHNAKLLILDEATSGLDPIIRDEILDIFYDFITDENHSILISSHIVSDLEKLCDYITFIHDGKLLFCEEKDSLIDEYCIVKCSKDELNQINQTDIIGKRVSSFGIEALIKKSKIPQSMTTEKPTIEDIIVFFAKGGDR